MSASPGRPEKRPVPLGETAGGAGGARAKLGRDEIARRIPHQGAMCLLAGVEDWDEETIRCRADSHHDPANPLREGGALPAVCGVEYAAQAMALHGALLAADDGPPRMGFLASVRGVEVRRARLDDVAVELSVSARRLSGDARNVLYEFAVSAGEELLLRGRAAVVLDAGLGPAVEGTR